MFENREEAGELLALKLRKIIRGPSASFGSAQDKRSGQEGFVVVALLRGGIVLGKKISDYFKIPLMFLAVKKIGAPLNSELAIGAVTFDKTYYFDKDLIKHLNIDEDYIRSSLEIKCKEAQALQKKLKNRISLKDRKIIIVDDGIATGNTAICASIYAKKENAQRVILAIPVIAKDTLNNLKRYFDRVVSLKSVDSLSSVSQFYKYFPQITDEEVLSFLL